MLGAGCWVLDTGGWVLGAGYWILTAAATAAATRPLSLVPILASYSTPIQLFCLKLRTKSMKKKALQGFYPLAGLIMV